MGPLFQNPKSSNRSRKNQKSLYPILSITYIHPPPPNDPKNRTPPATMQAESRGEVCQQTTKRGWTRDVARARRSARFQRAVSPSVATCLCPHQLETPVAIRSANPSLQTKTQEHRKTAIVSASWTLAHPAPSPQVIENKNTTGMNETREAQNRGKHPENMAYHDIS